MDAKNLSLQYESRLVQVNFSEFDENDAGERLLPEIYATRDEAALQSYSAFDAETGIRAVVNGCGALTELDIPQSQVNPARCEHLSQCISRLILDSRQKADLAARQRLFEIIGSELPIGALLEPPEQPADSTAEQPPPSRPAPTPDWADDDEYFTHLTFLR